MNERKRETKKEFRFYYSHYLGQDGQERRAGDRLSYYDNKQNIFLRYP